MSDKLKFCPRCAGLKTVKDFDKSKYRKDGLMWECKQCRAMMRLKFKHDTKTIIFNHYGSCRCCGENNIYFLTIDHINNDGAEHSRKIYPLNNKRVSGIAFYRWIIRNNFPDNLQSLCWNCNAGKQYSGLGICPHKFFENVSNSINPFEGLTNSWTN